MIPSLLFLADILPMSELSPGTLFAAAVMRRLILAKDSRWMMKLSFTA
jgi:hypothetical protein